jgi:hypothetical protein
MNREHFPNEEIEPVEQVTDYLKLIANRKIMISFFGIDDFTNLGHNAFFQPRNSKSVLTVSPKRDSTCPRSSEIPVFLLPACRNPKTGMTLLVGIDGKLERGYLVQKVRSRTFSVRSVSFMVLERQYG